MGELLSVPRRLGTYCITQATVAPICGVRDVCHHIPSSLVVLTILDTRSDTLATGRVASPTKSGRTGCATHSVPSGTFLLARYRGFSSERSAGTSKTVRGRTCTSAPQGLTSKPSLSLVCTPWAVCKNNHTLSLASWRQIPTAPTPTLLNHLLFTLCSGWPRCEGPCDNPDFSQTCSCAVHDNPIYAYPHNGVNAALIGGIVYRGYQLPQKYYAAYFFADFARKELRCIFFAPDGQTVIGEETFDDDAGQIVSIVQGPDVSAILPKRLRNDG